MKENQLPVKTRDGERLMNKDLEPGFNLYKIMDILDMDGLIEQTEETLTITYPDQNEPWMIIRCGAHSRDGHDGLLEIETCTQSVETEQVRLELPMPKPIDAEGTKHCLPQTLRGALEKLLNIDYFREGIIKPDDI